MHRVGRTIGGYESARAACKEKYCYYVMYYCKTTGYRKVRFLQEISLKQHFSMLRKSAEVPGEL